MIHEIQFGITLLAIIGAVTLLARRWQIPEPIPLVLVGMLFSFLPGFPRIELSPDIVLLIVLPPLVYMAGVATSWPEFRRDIRPIVFLAIGAVLFSTGLIALAGVWVAGLTWASAFVLGAVISPPDVIAPMAVVGRLRVPRRLATILNGEGLVNDVTALVLVTISVTAVVTGGLSYTGAAGTFASVLIGEMAWGLLVGWAALHTRHWARDTRVEITLSILTPYLAFWLPHAIGGSGVLATAVAGLYASFVGPRLISAATRLQGTFFWNFIIYILTGMVFLLTGLQARTIVADLGDYGWRTLALDAAAVCAVTVIARFAWIYMSAYLPPFHIRPRPNWRSPFLLAFTGIRGVVSLAAALSVPLTVANGDPFPGRELILFLTFTAILVTLVVQGLALPTLIRGLGLDRVGATEARQEEQQELSVLSAVEVRASERLAAVAAKVGIGDEVTAELRARYESRSRHAKRMCMDAEAAAKIDKVELAMIAAQRDMAWEQFAASKITDEARRRIEHELDLEEARIRRDPGEAVADGT